MSLSPQHRLKQPALFTPEPVVPEAEEPREVFRRIRNFLAGRFVGATRDESLLTEVLKCLYCRIHMDGHPDILEGRKLSELATSDQTALSKLCRRAFREIREENPEIFTRQEEIQLDPAALAYTMGSLAGVTLLDGDRDAIGDAFEVFIGSNVRGQDGQFFTPRTAASFLIAAVQPSLKDRVLDPACGAGGFLSATVQYLAREGASSKKIAAFATSQLYGIDKDHYLVGLAQAHVTLATRARPHIVCADSLAWNPHADETLDSFPGEGEYDVVLTNPPFGSNIVAATGSVLQAYALARKWRQGVKGKLTPTAEFQNNVAPQVLFVEKCVKLARPGGRIGIVLPESLVSSKMHRYVIEYLRAECNITAIIGMPESLFKTSGKGGTHTKTCLVVLERREGATARPTTSKLFMAEARWCGHDSRGKTIPHDDLPEVQKNLEAFQRGKLNSASVLGFPVADDEIRDNVLAPRYYDPKVSLALAELASTHHMVRFRDLIARGQVQVTTGDEIGKLAYSTGDIPFVRTSDLSNWEIKVDPKHGVSQEIYERYRRRQDVRAGDILMVRDGTYLIGTCALVTEHDTKIIYQSHLYKIRVLENDLGLDPYLLLAVLSSDIVQQQILAKRFTQDIIDSLGDRIAELVLPIWKNAARRDRLTEMVTTAITTRIEARETSRLARELVARV